MLFFSLVENTAAKNQKVLTMDSMQAMTSKVLHSRKTAQRTIGTARRNAQEESEH